MAGQGQPEVTPAGPPMYPLQPGADGCVRIDRDDDPLRPYGERAIAEAMDAGLGHAELESLLRGRLTTDVVPPDPGEELEVYADRAVSEFLVLYIARYDSGPIGRGKAG